MKRIITIVLAVVMTVAALVPMSSSAASIADFVDVKPGSWYYDAVNYCVERGIMAGTSATTFEPSKPLTRAMFVTMLAAYDKADVAEYAGKAIFTDVPAGKWYTAAVNWAATEGIVSGTGAGKFTPNASITREQLAVMLRAYAEYKGLYTKYLESSYENFADLSSVSGWAGEGARWAVGYGLISGMGAADGKPLFTPKGTATRAQAAVMITKLDMGARADKTFTIAGNDISLYRVVIPQAAVKKGDLEYLLDAAQAFVGYIRGAFGVTLPVVYDVEEPTDYEIVIGRTARENNGLVSVEVNGKSDICFRVDVQGSRLVIAGETDGDMRRGSLYGMYDFCEDALGYHFYNDDCTVRDNVSVAIPADYALTGGPEFLSRTVYWSRGWDEVYYNDEYYSCANLTHELPNWIDPKLGPSDATPCLSSENNIQKIINTVRSKLQKKYRDTIYLCCGDNDNGYCKCANCVAAYREDGTTAATLVRLANRVCEELHDDYPDFKVKLMAYLYTAAPPKVTKLNDHIIVYYCPITACASHTFDDPDCKTNRTIRAEAEGWAALASEMYVWDYSANFNYLSCPLPDFETILENARFLHDLGVTGMFNNAVTGRVGEFGELRAFLLTRVYRDPQMTKERYYKLMDGFLRNWYGPGWREVRSFIDLIEQTSESRHFICEARPSSMYDLDAVAEQADTILRQWDTALAMAETDAQREHVRRSRVCGLFLVQSALFKSMVTQGTDATRAEYYARNDELYNEMIACGVKWNEDKSEIPFNRTFAPENW